MRHTSAPSPSFVDPSSLSLPSPPSETSASPQSPVIDPSLVPTGSGSPSTLPPRKRARTDATPEEKREARAHRNRIAAQNSRDKRKAQFTQLEDKVRILQQENDQLRAQLEQERQRRDGAEKERENAELKERVKSLEEGWEAVLKALQSQGPPSSTFTNSSNNNGPAPPTTAVSDPAPPQPPTTTFPVFINTSPVLPLSPLSSSSTGGDRRFYSDVPAAGGFAQQSSMSALDIELGLVSSTVTAHSAQDISEMPADEDSRIEDWFREVLASTDSPATITVTSSSTSGVSPTGTCSEQEASPSNMISCELPQGSIGEVRDEAEMEQLLNLLPDPGDEFQSLLASVIEDGKVSEAKDEEGFNWEFVQSSVAVV